MIRETPSPPPQQTSDNDMENYMTIVSRADLVGGYQGHSSFLELFALLKA